MPDPLYTPIDGTSQRILFSSIGLFDERLDSQDGMEDYELVLRAFDCLRLLPCVAGRRIGLVIRHPTGFPQKVAMEENAITTIEAGYPKEVVNTVRAHLRSQALIVCEVA